MTCVDVFAIAHAFVENRTKIEQNEFNTELLLN